jgi:hypothetical protein
VEKLKGKKFLFVLIGLSLSSALLFAVGAKEYFTVVNSYAEQNQVIPLSQIPIAVQLSGWLALVSFIFGIIRVLALKQWKYIFLIVFLSYIGVFVYSLLDLRRLRAA